MIILLAKKFLVGVIVYLFLKFVHTIFEASKEHSFVRLFIPCMVSSYAPSLLSMV